MPKRSKNADGGGGSSVATSPSGETLSPFARLVMMVCLTLMISLTTIVDCLFLNLISS